MAALLVLGLLSACRAGAAGGRQVTSPEPAPSSGAAAGSCTLAATGGLSRQAITAPGPSGPTADRSYELYVPRGVTGPVPLLVSLHGLGSNGTLQNVATHWSSFDDRQAAAGAPFVLALPDGVSTLWYWGADHSYDVTFVFDVIARIESSGCVDRSRVFVDGWSEGAYMAQRMACDSGDGGITLAAVHSYAGGDPAVVPPLCRPRQATPVLMSQGLDDDLVHPQQTGFPAFTAWATRYACSPPPAPYQSAQQLAGCRGGVAVDWWPITGFNHLTWSCPADLDWHNRGVWNFLTRRVAPPSTTCT